MARKDLPPDGKCLCWLEPVKRLKSRKHKTLGI